MVDTQPPPYPYPPPPRGRSASFWVALVLAVVLAVSLLMNLGVLAVFGIAAAIASRAGGVQGVPGETANRQFGEHLVEGSGDATIVVVDVRGVISDDRKESMFGSSPSMVERVHDELKQAAHDPKVKALILDLETPGGEVTASDAIHDEVVALRAAGKKVVAHMGSVCASGGYYVAAAADEIVCAPTTITGSIGVIFEVPDLHRLLDDKLGIGMTTITSGPNKDMLSPFKPIGDEQRRIVEALVAETYDRFVGVVVDGRRGRGKLPQDEDAARTAVRALADGRIYSGQQALALGLADRLGHVETAYDEARKLAGVAQARIVRYRRQGGLFDLFGGGGDEAKVNVNAGVQVDAGALRAAATPRMQYLWAPTP